MKFNSEFPLALIDSSLKHSTSSPKIPLSHNLSNPRNKQFHINNYELGMRGVLWKAVIVVQQYPQLLYPLKP
jgi:hypothetical protein